MQIKKVIDNHGESWASVAKKMQKTSSAIIQIADGNPTVGKLKQLASVIGCHWLDFFQDELEAEGLQLVKKTEQQETDTNQLPFGSPSAGGATREGQSLCADADATAHGDSPCVSPAMQQAIVCPHCQRAIAIMVKG